MAALVGSVHARNIEKLLEYRVDYVKELNKLDTSNPLNVRVALQWRLVLDQIGAIDLTIAAIKSLYTPTH